MIEFAFIIALSIVGGVAMVLDLLISSSRYRPLAPAVDYARLAEWEHDLGWDPAWHDPKVAAACIRCSAERKAVEAERVKAERESLAEAMRATAAGYTADEAARVDRRLVAVFDRLDAIQPCTARIVSEMQDVADALTILRAHHPIRGA